MTLVTATLTANPLTGNQPLQSANSGRDVGSMLGMTDTPDETDVEMAERVPSQDAPPSSGLAASSATGAAEARHDVRTTAVPAAPPQLQPLVAPIAVPATTRSVPAVPGSGSSSSLRMPGAPTAAAAAVHAAMDSVVGDDSDSDFDDSPGAAAAIATSRSSSSSSSAHLAARTLPANLPSAREGVAPTMPGRGGRGQLHHRGRGDRAGGRGTSLRSVSMKLLRKVRAVVAGAGPPDARPCRLATVRRVLTLCGDLCGRACSRDDAVRWQGPSPQPERSIRQRCASFSLQACV